MPRKKVMGPELEAEIRKDAKSKWVQRCLDEVATLVQHVVNESGRPGDLIGSNLLVVAYGDWQKQARDLLQHHWPDKKFHRWPILWSLYLCDDLNNLIEQLKNSRNDPPAMA